MVSDKIPALLTFFPEIALHITRPVRWDSDHVVLFDDETKELCKEIARCGGLTAVCIWRWTISMPPSTASPRGSRASCNVQKALLNALLTPDMTAEQNAGNFTDLLVRQEGTEDHALRRGLGRVLPPLRRAGRDGAWLPLVWAYEKNILEARA